MPDNHLAIRQLFGSWLLHPGRVDEDGLEWPPDAAICRAILLLPMLHGEWRCVPTGDGGVALKYVDGTFLRELSVYGGEPILDRFFVDGELVN